MAKGKKEAILCSGSHAVAARRLERGHAVCASGRRAPGPPATAGRLISSGESPLHIADHGAVWPVAPLSGVLQVPIAGYYAWRSHPEGKRAAENRAPLDDICRVRVSPPEAASWRPARVCGLAGVR